MFKIVNYDRKEQILRISRLYYIDGIEQSVIAQKENISRTTVSRILSTAREQGIVTITVNDNLHDAELLIKKLENKYSDVKFTVVSTDQDGQEEKNSKLSSVVANYLDQLIKNGDIIGIGWGKELYEIAKKVSFKNVRDVEIVSLQGMLSYPKYKSYVTESLNSFANAYKTIPQNLPLPIMFEKQNIKDLVEEDRHIRYIKKLGRVSNIALFTLSNVEESPILNKADYISDEQKQLIKKNTSGELLSHLIDKNGQIVDLKVDSLTESLPLSNLHHKEHSIVVVNKTDDVPILDTALNAGYINEVFIDQLSAQRLFEY